MQYFPEAYILLIIFTYKNLKWVFWEGYRRLWRRSSIIEVKSKLKMNSQAFETLWRVLLVWKGLRLSHNVLWKWARLDFDLTIWYWACISISIRLSLLSPISTYFLYVSVFLYGEGRPFSPELNWRYTVTKPCWAAGFSCPLAYWTGEGTCRGTLRLTQREVKCEAKLFLGWSVGYTSVHRRKLHQVALFCSGSHAGSRLPPIWEICKVSLLTALLLSRSCFGEHRSVMHFSSTN